MHCKEHLHLEVCETKFVYDVCLYNDIIVTVNGDISFGSNIIRPTFQFVGTLLPPSPPIRTITLDVNTDNILEGQEIGLLTIAPSTFFDGFVPRFQSVKIIITDSNSEWIAILPCMHHIACFHVSVVTLHYSLL